MRRLSIFACVALAGALGCGTSESRRNGQDMAVGPGSDGSASGCSQTDPCPAGNVCFDGQCIPDNGSCTSDDDCENDTYCDCTGGGGGDAGACMGGLCVPWGVPPRGLFDPGCAGQSFSASQFVAPQLKCKYDTGSPTVLVTPIVADLDGDGKPEVTFSAYPDSFVSIHGTDCSVYFSKTFTFGSSNQTQIAVGDLDGDGKPEIVGTNESYQVVVFDNQGNLVATSPQSYGPLSATQDWSAPAIVDIDGQKPAEIVMAGQVLRYNAGAKTVTPLWTKQPTAVADWGTVSIAADLDGDGKAEVIVGKQIFDGVTGVDKTPAALTQGLSTGAGAYAATGDFNGDKKPDLVFVQAATGAERVSIYDYANGKFIFGPFDVPNGWGGPPTVADFDGDGVPEFGSAGPHNYFVFSMKCQPGNKAPQCDQTTNFGVLWKKDTQDVSSGGTGSSVFDFNGDGKAEVVYRDECWLRVYNGPDGKTVFAANVTSVTCLEVPVIADVDNDGHADIIVAGDTLDTGICMPVPEAETNTPWSGGAGGIRIYRDPMNRWEPSRSVWNQNSYHITNVNDDLTIPTAETPNWTTWNNYRQNTEGLAMNGGPEADFTGGKASTIDQGPGDCTTTWNLYANLCNRGTATVAAGVPGTFYSGDPRQGGMKICTATTQGALNPGNCETVECTWMNPPQGAVDIWFRADDDGMTMPQGECKTKNDLLHMPSECQKVG
jgi:hypothetical protein